MRAQIAHATARLGAWRVDLLDLFFPPRCIGCRRLGHAFCSECLSRVEFVAPPICPCCGRALARAGRLCPDCCECPPHCARLRAASYHEGVLRLAIHAYKYERRTELTGPLVTLLERQLGHDPFEFDVITSVPLHQARERERGYNQAELLARELAARLGRPYIAGLRRIRATADQIGLNPAERHKNVRDAFRADAGAFTERRVLVIDDVCTTGATLDACAVALQAEGANLVYGLTVARARNRVFNPSFSASA